MTPFIIICVLIAPVMIYYGIRGVYRQGVRDGLHLARIRAEHPELAKAAAASISIYGSKMLGPIDP